MELYVNPTITDFRQDVNGDIKMLKIGVEKEDAYANIIGQGGSANLQDKETTIDVSAYTEPVVVTPSKGYKGMRTTTITLSNIPSPSGVSTLYCWQTGGKYNIYTFTSTPTTSDKAIEGVYDPSDDNVAIEVRTITAVGEGVITVNDGEYERYSEGDISLT